MRKSFIVADLTKHHVSWSLHTYNDNETDADDKVDQPGTSYIGDAAVKL